MRNRLKNALKRWRSRKRANEILEKMNEGAKEILNDPGWEEAKAKAKELREAEEKRITDEFREEVKEWLTKNNILKKCEVCKHSDFSISEFLFGMQDCRLDKGYVYFGDWAEGKALTFVVVTCKSCSNAKFFNLDMIAKIKEGVKDGKSN